MDLFLERCACYWQCGCAAKRGRELKLKQAEERALIETCWGAAPAAKRPVGHAGLLLGRAAVADPNKRTAWRPNTASVARPDWGSSGGCLRDDSESSRHGLTSRRDTAASRYPGQPKS